MEILHRLPQELQRRVFDHMQLFDIHTLVQNASHDFRIFVQVSYLPFRALERDGLTTDSTLDPDPWVFMVPVSKEKMVAALGTAEPVIRALLEERDAYISGGFARGDGQATDIDVFTESASRMERVILDMTWRLQANGFVDCGVRVWREHQGEIAMIYVPGCRLPIQVIAVTNEWNGIRGAIGGPEDFDLSHCKCKISLENGQYVFSATSLYMFSTLTRVSVFNRWSDWRPGRIEKARQKGFTVLHNASSETIAELKGEDRKDRLWGTFWRALTAELRAGTVTMRCKPLPWSDLSVRSFAARWMGLAAIPAQSRTQIGTDYSSMTGNLEVSVVRRAQKADSGDWIIFVLEVGRPVYVPANIAMLVSDDAADRFLTWREVLEHGYVGWNIIHQKTRDGGTHCVECPVLLFE